MIIFFVFSSFVFHFVLLTVDFLSTRSDVFLSVCDDEEGQPRRSGRRQRGQLVCVRVCVCVCVCVFVCVGESMCVDECVRSYLCVYMHEHNMVSR